VVVRGDPNGFRVAHDGRAGDTRLQGGGCGRSSGGTVIVIAVVDPDTVTVTLLRVTAVSSAGEVIVCDNVVTTTAGATSAYGPTIKMVISSSSGYLHCRQHIVIPHWKGVDFPSRRHATKATPARRQRPLYNAV